MICFAARKIPIVAGSDRNKHNSKERFCIKFTFVNLDLKTSFDKLGKITVAIAIPVKAKGS